MIISVPKYHVTHRSVEKVEKEGSITIFGVLRY